MLQAVSEQGMDGIALVRSTDPSRLLVSAGSNLPGTDQILMSSVDAGPYSPFLFGQGLSDTGQVDVVVEGRSTAQSKGIYPRQRLRVRLAPTALFLSSPKDVSIAVNSRVDVNFVQAPVLPDGTAGIAGGLRVGVTSSPGLTTSPADGLPGLTRSVYRGGAARGHPAGATAENA